MMKFPDSLWSPGCFRDSAFWLAAALGPLVWLLLWGVVRQPLTAGSGSAAAALLLAIVVYPVLEEIVFRGALQGWLLSLQPLAVRWGGITAANVLTSVVFTGFHFIHQSPLWAAAVLPPALVFGWARDRYQSLTPCVVLHMFYNAGFLLLFA